MYWCPVLQIHDVYDVHPGSRIRFFPSRIPDPGLTRSRLPDPCQTQRISVFFSHKIDTQYSKIRSGMFIPDPGSWIWIFFHPWSRIRISDPEIKKAPDPGSRIRNTGYLRKSLCDTEGAANFNFLKIITRDSQMKPVATQKGRPRKCKLVCWTKKWSFRNLIYILYVEQNSIGILVCQKMDRIVSFLDICWMIGVFINKVLLYNNVWYPVAMEK